MATPSNDKKLVLLELVNILRSRNGVEKLTCFEQCEYQCQLKITSDNIDYLIATMQDEVMKLHPDKILQ